VTTILRMVSARAAFGRPHPSGARSGRAAVADRGKRIAVLRFWLLLGWIAIVCGCGQTGPRTYPVSGTVTFNGKPVAEGDIVFIPPDRSLAPEGGRIVDGVFAMRSKEGKCRVEITASEVGPNTPRVDGVPLITNYIPARYNSRSVLSAEVAPDGENTFDFRLKGP